MIKGVLYTIKVSNRHYLTGYYIGDTTAPIPTQSYHDADHISGPAIWWSNKPGRLPGSKACEKILRSDILNIWALRKENEAWSEEEGQ